MYFLSNGLLLCTLRNTSFSQDYKGILKYFLLKFKQCFVFCCCFGLVCVCVCGGGTGALTQGFHIEPLHQP
jgi:hypothetical protein